VLRLARTESRVQNKHFEFFTVLKTHKITELQNFENLALNFQKKLNISETVRVTEVLQETKNV